MRVDLGMIDYLTFSLTIVATAGFALWASTKKKRDHLVDFFLMGRSLTTPMFVATLVATWYGGIFGTAQIAFESGVYNFITQGVFWYISYIIFALFIIDRIDRDRRVTLADLIGDRFGPQSRKVAALFNILNLVPIAYVISIGLLIQFFWDIPLIWASTIGTCFVVLYSMFGGIRAVVYSDMIQFFIMITSVVLVFAFSLYSFGVDPLKQLPQRYFSLTGGHSWADTLIWGFLAIATLVDPNFYHRSFAAKSTKVAKRGIFYSTLVWMVFDLSLTFGAMYAASLTPDAPADKAYFIYAFNILPVGLKGLFLGGIVATVLSTLDSYLFLSGATYSYDLSGQKSRKSHYIAICVTATLAILLSMVFEGNIKSVWKALGSLSTSALLIPTLFGILATKRALSDKSFVFTALAAATITIWWRLSGLKQDLGIDELYVGAAASLIFITVLQKKLVHK